MCGIAGILERSGATPSVELLAAMAGTLSHRGPDGQGEQAFPGCGLAHRRLAIIDLSARGAQPMGSLTAPLWIAFNGEIYNFQELKAQLVARGHRFFSATDTEVILAAVAEWGEDAVEKLDGMFAFALWDLRSRRLLLARDRTGKKPLFVYEDARRLVFASELKAIRLHPGLDLSRRPEAVAEYLTHGYVPTPGTFYRRIRSVEPGSLELHQLGDRPPVVRQYWDFPLGPERKLHTAAQLDEATQQVRETFTAAVRRRLVSDVPLGAFLSGGIDSTLVVGVMSQLSSRPVRTFSIGVKDHPDWDETSYARLASQRFGTEHTEFKVDADSFGLVDRLFHHIEQPFADSSLIPTSIVSRLTREAGVTVALTGDGGDEAFAGYPRFLAATAAELVPGPVRGGLNTLLGLLPAHPRHESRYERLRRLGLKATRPLPERMLSWSCILEPAEVQGLLEPEYAAHAGLDALVAPYRRLFERARQAGASPLNQVLYVNARTYLLDDLNPKVDRASMAHGLEARSPFLDTALLELAFRLPDSAKLHGSTTKWILKRAFADLLPREILGRSKMGFGLPMSAWLRAAQPETLAGRLNSGLAGVVRPRAVERLVERLAQGQRDLGPQLYTLDLLRRFLA